MSTTTTITHPTLDTEHRHARTGNSPTIRRSRVCTAGVTAGVAAAVATSVVAIVAAAAGEKVAIAGKPIPAGGFASLTLLGAVLGIAIAKLVQRTRRPRTVFVTATVSLTALSIIPDLVVDTVWASRLLLAATHVVAAAIIVPALARRLEP